MTVSLDTWKEWARHTVAELRPVIADGAIGLWAIGATEQHGEHLVTGFDHLTSEAIVRAAAAELGDAAVVFPTLPFGCSNYWLEIGGTLSLSQDTMRRVVLDVCGSAAAARLRHLIIVNGHSGNIGIVTAAVNEFGPTDTLVELVSYWNLIDRGRVVDLTDASLEDGFGHAGQFETAIGMHIDGMVRLDHIPAHDGQLDPEAPGGFAVAFHRAPDPERDTRAGVIGDAAAASAEIGAAAFDLAVAGLLQHCRDVLCVDSDRYHTATKGGRRV